MNGPFSPSRIELVRRLLEELSLTIGENFPFELATIAHSANARDSLLARIGLDLLGSSKSVFLSEILTLSPSEVRTIASALVASVGSDEDRQSWRGPHGLAGRRIRALKIAEPEVWLDVVSHTIDQAKSLAVAAEELGVSVEMLRRWVKEIELKGSHT